MAYKKIAAFAAALAISSAMLSACGNSSQENTENSVTSSDVTTASAAPEITDEETSADTLSSEENDGNASVSEESSAEGSVLQTAAESAIEGQEWPAMSAVDNNEKEFISDFFLLDTEDPNYKDLFIFQCPMSANMSEIIIIEADDVSSAKADLEARQKKAREQDAFYPDDVERAGASIVGTEGPYAYFIMGNNAEDVEAALDELLK